MGDGITSTKVNTVGGSSELYYPKQKHPGGRPRKYNDEQVKEIVDKLTKYIDNTDMPIVAEFAYYNDIIREELYDYSEFSTLLKKLICKKETYIEREGLLGRINPTMAVFSLKQLGWSDRREISGPEGKAIEITIDKAFDGV